MNSTDIKNELLRCFDNYDYKLFNTYIFNNESDFFCVSSSGYVIEVEIKISRSDFKNDFKKTHWNGVNKHENLKSDSTYKPNKFYFAVPENMVTKDEIPDYAGLIYIVETGIKYKSHYIVKNAKFLHKENLFKKLNFVTKLMNKFYYQNQDLKRQMKISESEIKSGQKIIDLFYQ